MQKRKAAIFFWAGIVFSFAFSIRFQAASFIAGIVFYGYGFGLYGRLERFELLYVVIGIWIFQLIASPIWLNSFRYGPAEWLWRSLTYLKLQPFRKRN